MGIMPDPGGACLPLLAGQWRLRSGSLRSLKSALTTRSPHAAGGRLPVVTVAFAVVLAFASGCGSTPGEPSASSAPAATLVPSLHMGIDQPIVAGQPFQVFFTGQLSKARGGYLFVKDTSGTKVGLLRSDGNPQIPMGYELDPARWDMLADSLSGNESTFVFPPELRAGGYTLCTANSGPEDCTQVEVITT